MTSPPISIPLTEPTSTPTRRYDFDHIPKLGPAKPGDRRGSLLPQEGGRPGLTYAQVPLRHVRQLEAADPPWFPMFDTCRYTIVGPKGSIDMELMAQGSIISGVPASAVKCPCFAPITLICAETGLEPGTGFPPLNQPLTEEAPDAQEPQPQETDPGLEAGSLPGDSEPQDPTSEERGPEPHTSTSGGKGKGHPRKP
jgi:hypothetical protein